VMIELGGHGFLTESSDGKPQTWQRDAMQLLIGTSCTVVSVM